MAEPMQPLIPGMDQVIANLQSLPMVTGQAEQFIGPSGSAPPALAGMPQYAGLEIASRAVPCTNFDAFAHGQLVANVEPIQAAAVVAFRQEWASAANEVTDTFETLASKIGRAVAEKWRGGAGEAASAAIVGYAQEAIRMADASNLVARQVGSLADSLDRTKANLPGEPAETVPSKIVGLFGADGWDDERRDAAKQQAVQLLNTVYYGGGISPTAQAMPVFPAVKSPIAGGPGEPSGAPFAGGSPGFGVGTAGFGGGGTPSTYSGGSPVEGAVPAATDSAGAPSGLEPDSAAGEASPGTGVDRTSGLPGSADKTVAAGYQPTGVPGGGAGLGGGTSGAGAGGIGAGGAGAATLGSPSLGGGVVGGAPGGARPMAASPGRAGMPGMGMAPMGARGKGEDDREHKSSDYLHNDELAEWVDEQTRRGVVPVIGAPRPRPDGDAGAQR